MIAHTFNNPRNLSVQKAHYIPELASDQGKVIPDCPEVVDLLPPELPKLEETTQTQSKPKGQGFFRRKWKGMRTLYNNNKENISWMCNVFQLAIFVAIITHICSVGKSISSLIVLSSAFQLFACLGLFNSNQFVHSSTLKLFIISVAMRSTVVMMTGGYKPKDKTGQWLFQTLDFVSLILMIIGHAGSRISWTQTRREWMMCILISVCCFLLGSMWHINLVKKFVYDSMWASSIFVECAAMIPQIYSIFNQHRTQCNLSAENLCEKTIAQNGQFITMMFFSRIVSTTFWTYIYFTMTTEHDYTMILLVLCQGFQLIAACDIVYLYAKETVKGYVDFKKIRQNKQLQWV